MIFATIGTNEQPFDRLVSAVAGLPGHEELVIQYGSATVPHGRGRWVDYMPYEEMSDLMRAARVVVCHAGVGSIMLARRCGHRPVVLAREVGRAEAVDDHQVALAVRLHAAGLVTFVPDESDLPGIVDAELSSQRPSAGRLAGAAALCGAVHADLVLAAPSRRTL